jgi:hypothetical protein
VLGDLRAKFDPQNSVFQQNRENPEKTLVESASAIYDTAYL